MVLTCKECTCSGDSAFVGMRWMVFVSISGQHQEHLHNMYSCAFSVSHANKDIGVIILLIQQGTLVG